MTKQADLTPQLRSEPTPHLRSTIYILGGDDGSEPCSEVSRTPEGQGPAGGPVMVETGWIIESDPELVMIFDVGEQVHDQNGAL